MKDIKEIIPIKKDKEGNQAISMRDLYKWLDARAEFTTWSKRMFSYGFTENVDFVGFDKIVNSDKGFGGHLKVRDYVITLDTAKEISMIQRNDKGKQARKYFISMEKQAKQQLLPKTPQEMTRALLENMDANNEDIKALKSDVSFLKSERKLTSPEYSYISKTVNRNVYKIVNDKGLNKDQKNLLFKDISSQILSLTGVRFRSQLQLKHFDDVCELLDNWYPSSKTMVEVRKIGNQTKLDV
ncbi:antA/AntB antirepressor family protein [Nicoliella lavandulae]|uniref:AntA/AntB antirepressor family protein n=1 Tax=Nicoliella lavandulae TaxID=3082954 RepID=A0ABU8SM73_9LACO